MHEGINTSAAPSFLQESPELVTDDLKPAVLGPAVLVTDGLHIGEQPALDTVYPTSTTIWELVSQLQLRIEVLELKVGHLEVCVFLLSLGLST